jgi:hypothetical protein
MLGKKKDNTDDQNIANMHQSCCTIQFSMKISADAQTNTHKSTCLEMQTSTADP